MNILHLVRQALGARCEHAWEYETPRGWDYFRGCLLCDEVQMMRPGSIDWPKWRTVKGWEGGKGTWSKIKLELVEQHHYDEKDFRMEPWMTER